MCTAFGVGGIARHVLDLSEWLRARGHRVTFSGTAHAWLSSATEQDFVPINTAYVAGEGANIVSRISNAIWSAARLRVWLARNKVDVIHAHESAPALVARLATLGLRIPVAVTYHGSEPERVRQFASTVKFADLVITPSHRSASHLEEIGGIDRRKIAVIGLGLKPPPSFEPERVSAVRRELLGDAGAKLAVTIARLAEQKGIDVLIECVRRMISDHPEFRFAVVGDGPLEDEVESMAHRAGVLSHLRFVGRSPTPHLYLRAADLFLLTSRWEALPITIAEAFQEGTPVVATDCGGVAELVDESVGKVVPIGDVDAICRAATEILTDDNLREALAKNAAERSREDRFSPDHINRKFEAVYRKLAARSTPDS
jgi:glycosyltransferase involved in cell wall biosynthesis